MYTSNTETPAVTFHHDGIPDGGDLHIVIDLDQANLYNADQKMQSKYGYNTVKFETEEQTIYHGPTVQIVLPYNFVRDLVLDKLRYRTISQLESMDSEELVQYFVNADKFPA